MDLNRIFLNDLHIFFDEISEDVQINYIEVNVVLDHDKLQDRSKKEYDGISVGDILYFAKKEELLKKLGGIPNSGDIQNFNGRTCTVFDVREDKGLIEVILNSNGNKFENSGW